MTKLILLICTLSSCGVLPPERAGCIIESTGGEFLLTRLHILNLIDIPAGGIDPNETSMEAAIRETKEETGALVEITSALGIFGKTAVYRCNIIGGTIVPSTNETHSVGFYNISSFKPKDYFKPWTHQLLSQEALK